jgi:tRNA modification GTPase
LYNPSLPPSQDAILDSNALILYFPAPKTVTGEDLLELHVHGGPAVVKAVLQALSKCNTSKSTVRYAEPGEFTRRAFLNDRIDLTQVEALGDTLSAATEQQRKLSVRGTGGKLAKQYEEWRTQLLYARGELEALIDFSEDQHFDESPAVLASSVAAQILELSALISTHINNAVRGELLRNGISIALLGAPNAGKSSLLNRIVGREAAIVSREAGTTRDVVEVGIDLGGYLCRVGDMAGLRTNRLGANKAETIGTVEKEGIKRARQRALESDVVILVLPFSCGCSGAWAVDVEHEVLETAKESAERGSKIIAVLSKVDLLPADSSRSIQIATKSLLKRIPYLTPELLFPASCKPTSDDKLTEADTSNIPSLLSGLLKVFEDMTSAISPVGDGSSDPSIWQESLGASERHRLLLETCLQHLNTFLSQITIDESKFEEDLDVVLAAESLRVAADCLARITGRGEAGDVEEVLGVVFEKYANCLSQLREKPSANSVHRFCVGK